ncbi:MAG TPA: flagellin [Candidatus Ozemobacteraceae bacterium]|nr:flagellin [Candidatus Ozemobacteraceae bacterium]
MSLRINQNVLAIQTQGMLSSTSGRLEKVVEKLSSGLRINRAADDAAGLAISEKIRRQVRGLSRAIMNAQDGISMIQTAEGALGESHSILQRMRELAIQASSDTLTSGDRLEIQKEVNQLRDDLNRIARNTEFNTKKLLDGSQTALVSGSSDSVKGVVVGSAGAVGGDYEVSLTLLQGGISEMQRSQTFLKNDGSGQIAQGSTSLQSIAQFYDANGVFVLQSPQTLTINGSGKSTSITVDGQMSLDQLAAAVQNAIVGASGLDMANTRIEVVNTATTGLAGMGGYLQTISGSIGQAGQISFSGDQALMDALGMTVTRTAVENQIEMTLRDANGNTKTALTTDSRVTGLLSGIDLAFTSQAAQVAGTKGLQQGLELTNSVVLTISAGTTNVTVGVVSGDWTMEGIARAINDQVVTVIEGLSAAVVDGQIRISYDRPATAPVSIGTTIRISGANNEAVATLGIVNGTYSGFVQGQKDEAKSVWGFSMYNGTISATTATFGISDGTKAALTITAFVTTSVGSTADMVRFTTFQASVNRLLESTATSTTRAVRVDQVGATIAFTALRVGQENPDNAAVIRSMVTFNGGNLVNQLFDLSNGTALGSGDKNFRVHVVDNTPKFQIGGDPGQSMAVGFASMNAEALGVQSLDMSSISGAERSLAKVNAAIDKVSAERSKLGAFQNRLEYSINNLRNTYSNLSAAESRIRDADIALEMIEFTRNQIVNQSGTAMLAQANLLPSGVLELLR